mgnify:CR=1 FL=1
MVRLDYNRDYGSLMRLEYRSSSPRDKWVLLDDRGNVIIMAESRATCLNYAVTKGYDITKLEKVW